MSFQKTEDAEADDGFDAREVDDTAVAVTIVDVVGVVDQDCDNRTAPSTPVTRLGLHTLDLR